MRGGWMAAAGLVLTSCAGDAGDVEDAERAAVVPAPFTARPSACATEDRAPPDRIEAIDVVFAWGGTDYTVIRGETDEDQGFVAETFGLAGPDGAAVMEPRYDSMSFAPDGDHLMVGCLVRSRDGTSSMAYGFVDREGTEVVPAAFASVLPPRDGVAAVIHASEGYAFIGTVDAAGLVTPGPVFAGLAGFFEDRAIARDADGRTGIVDAGGAWIYGPADHYSLRLLSFYGHEQGPLWFEAILAPNLTGSAGVLDADGAWVVHPDIGYDEWQPEYDDPRSGEVGPYLVGERVVPGTVDAYGFADVHRALFSRDGREIVPPRYDYVFLPRAFAPRPDGTRAYFGVRNYPEGHERFSVAADRTGLVDAEGREVLAPIYDVVAPLSDDDLLALGPAAAGHLIASLDDRVRMFAPEGTPVTGWHEDFQTLASAWADR